MSYDETHGVIEAEDAESLVWHIPPDLSKRLVDFVASAHMAGAESITTASCLYLATESFVDSAMTQLKEVQNNGGSGKETEGDSSG